MPHAFSYTPGDLQQSITADLSWLSDASRYRNHPAYSNQFAMVSKRVFDNSDMLTPSELSAVLQRVPMVPGVSNELLK